MTIFQIECFLAVAEFLNFAKAAEQMNISQPAITRQIQSLEDELGGKLFQRSTRVVRLTENGHIFMVEAQTMVAAAQRSIRRFSMNDREEILDFEVVNDNGEVLQPKTQIKGQEIVLTIPDKETEVKLIRYCYRTSNIGALVYNQAGLPMSPFVRRVYEETV